MLGMVGLLSAKTWFSDMLREVKWWHWAGLAGGVHLLKSDFDLLVLFVTLNKKNIVDIFGKLEKVGSGPQLLLVFLFNTKLVFEEWWI